MTRGETVTGCTAGMSFCCKGLISIKKNNNAREITERLKFEGFYICLNILHFEVYANADTEAIAIAHLHICAVALMK